MPTHGNTALKPTFDDEVDYDPLPSPLEELDIPPAERATILTLKEHMCRWPIGDPQEADFHFCGRASATGMPYCQHHARVAYQPLNSRRRDQRAARG